MPHPSIADVDIKLLRVFCKIVRCGGFALAQAEMNLSRSTISTHMSNLETRLGVKLCTRGRAGFALTAHGAAVYEASRAMLASIDEYYARIGELKERIVGEIVIGVVDNLITNPECLLHAAVREAIGAAQDLKIVLRIGPPDYVEDQLVRGQVHLAVTPQFQARKGMSQVPLFVEKQLLICARGHVLFDREEAEMTPELIAEQNSVRRGYASPLTAYSSVFRNPSLAVSQQMEGIAHFILSGNYVGFLPEAYANHWIERNVMRSIRPDLFSFDVPICLSCHNNLRQSLAAAHVHSTILNIYGLPI